MPLPRWVCHKEVLGDTIVEIREIVGVRGAVIGHQWVLACGVVIDVVRAWVARSSPVVGDYMVQYGDGYISWSPRQVFEDGYTRKG